MAKFSFGDFTNAVGKAVSGIKPVVSQFSPVGVIGAAGSAAKDVGAGVGSAAKGIGGGLGDVFSGLSLPLLGIGAVVVIMMMQRH